MDVMVANFLSHEAKIFNKQFADAELVVKGFTNLLASMANKELRQEVKARCTALEPKFKIFCAANLFNCNG